MPLTLLTLPCVIVHRSEDEDTVDLHGNPWTNEELESAFCELQQLSARERVEGLSDATHRIFLLPGVLLDTSDAVIAEDILYEVEGDPWQVRDPEENVVHHVEATLRRTSGEEDGS